MKDIIVKINRNDSKAYLNDNELGIRGENLQGYLMLELTEMINGVGILEIEKEDGTKGYLVMEQYDKGYKLQIKSSLLADTGIIYMNLRVTEDGSLETPPVFKSRKFFLRILETIDATTEIPDEYPEWIDIANAKILEMDEALAEVDNLDIDASKVGKVATVSITNKDGITKSVNISDGEDGVDGKDAKINGVNTLTVEAGTNIGLEQEGSTLTIENTYDDSEILSDITYLKENKIDKDVDDLTNYTTTDGMNTAISTAVGNETTARQNADLNLQGQIDAITSSSDVVDIVGTYTDLQNYDTSSLTEDDVIKVLQDSTHNDALSYYRWHSNAWVYVGSEGPFYTKSESDALLNQKLEQSDLVDYVKNTDYATNIKGGTIKSSNWYGFAVNNDGTPNAQQKTYSDYENASIGMFIGKGTLENVITGKNLETANNKVTSMSASSTDTQYPSAKAVYDSQVEQDEEIDKKLNEQDAVSMFGNAIYGEIATPSKEFSIHTASSYFGRKLLQDKLENDLQLLGESTQDTSTIYYKCDGTESGDYYFVYNSVNYQFTMPTVASGDIIKFNTNSLVLSLNGTTISTTEASTGTLITMINTPSPDFPINIDNIKAYNKFDKVAATLNNTRYVLNADGTITNSTYWGGDGRNYFNAIFLKAGTYTLSYIPSLSGNGVERFSIKNITTDTDIENTSFGITNGQRYNYTFTLSADSNIGICIMANQQADGIMTLKEIQINEGTEVKPYRPFGCIQIDITGGNLLTTSRNISTTGNRTINISLPAGSYMFSWSNWASSSANSMSRIDLIYTDDTTTELTVYKTYYSKSANAIKPVKAIRIYSNTTEGNSRTITLTYSDFMLQPGTAPTLPYRPYVENHIYIPITHDMNGLDTTRDKIYWENGKWYDLKANGELIASGTTITISNAKANGKYMSTHKAAGNLSGTDLTFDSAVTNAEIIYELATPVITEITDIDTINALETIRTYTGLTVFTSDIDLTGSYVQDLSNGYDATKTQYLKNVNGILQWV